MEKEMRDVNRGKIKSNAESRDETFFMENVRTRERKIIQILPLKLIGVRDT